MAQGDPLGPEFRINTYTTNIQRRPSVASDSSGNFIVVWESFNQDGSERGVFGQRYANTGPQLGPEFRVNTYTTGIQSGPAVATDPAGNFVVVWSSQGQDGSSGGVFGQRYLGSGAPLGPEFRVNSYTIGTQGSPAVATDAAGNFVVVWHGGPSGLYDVFGQRYDGSGAALGAEFRINTHTSSSQMFPSVATDSTGNFVVVWGSFNQDGYVSGVFGQRYASSGTATGPEFRVNTYTQGNQTTASVAADAAGNFVVVWNSEDQDGSARGIFGQRYASSGVPLGPEFRVNTHTTNEQVAPSVAADSAGNFVVIWWSSPQDGSGYGIFGQRYASSGAPLGPEFRVNTYTSFSQLYAAVASDGAGDFVVVWASYQDGSYYGIYGQRYSQIVPVELMHFRVE